MNDFNWIKEILIGIGLGACFLVFLYYASQIVMKAWFKVIEKHFINKSKQKQNGKKTKK